jgi:hypothetical protein
LLFARLLEKPAAAARTAELGPAVEAHIAVPRTAEAQHIAEGKSTAGEVRHQPVLRVEDNSFDPEERIVEAHTPVEADTVVDIQEPADNLDKAFAQASGFQQRSAREN